MTQKENKTSQYFNNVEIQYETDIQKEAIIKALKDMLQLDEENLKAQRYPDFSGEERKWNILELVHGYFVPDDPKKIIDNNFFIEVQTPEVKNLIKDMLKKLV